ncbi:hypothetical protein D3C77_335490 [compost metagenome]
MTVQALRYAQLVQQARGYPHQAGQVGVAIEQHRKLVTGQTRHGIGFGDSVGNALGHLLEQLVRQLMTEAFIEQFEAIQVDVQQRQTAPIEPNTLTRIVQTQAEQRTVGQSGQVIIMGQVAQAFFRLTTCRQVGEEADNIADAAAGVANPVELQPLRVQVSILARFNQLTLPASLLVQGLLDGQAMASRIAAARQLQCVAR